MPYYHLRYNIYQEAGFPVEKERWLSFEECLDDNQVKLFLEKEHGNTVSVILSKEITLEEYSLIRRAILN